MTETWKKLSGETENGYIFRICSNKDIIGTWYDVADILNAELGREWNESAYRKRYQQGKAYMIEQQDELFESEAYIEKIRKEREELQRERIKLQTEKLEYNKWLREHARDEMFEEKVINSIYEVLGTVQAPNAIPVKHNERCGVLMIADCHYGKDVTVRGLDGSIINEYNPEVFEMRMHRLLSETIAYCQKEKLQYIKVFNLGDSIDGLLRASQVWNLRMGVIESALKFGEYMAKWLRALSEHVGVEYHPVLISNHSELRLLDGKKDQHLNESAEMVTIKLIETYNADNPNLVVVTNETGFIYTDAVGYKLFGAHGEFKNAEEALREYQEIYDVRIDYVVFGHKHTRTYKESAVRKGVIGVGSLCGIDDFSVKIRKASDASASMIIFEKDKGKVDEHTFILN